MAAKLLHVVAAACMLFVAHVQGKTDLAALRHEDIWPSESSVTGSGLTVDLGYGLYQGYNNVTSGLNIWKGYPPLRSNRDLCLELTLIGSASLRLLPGTSVGRRPKFRRQTGLWSKPRPSVQDVFRFQGQGYHSNQVPKRARTASSSMSTHRRR